MLTVRMVIDTCVVVAKKEAAGSISSSVHYSIELFSINAQYCTTGLWFSRNCCMKAQCALFPKCLFIYIVLSNDDNRAWKLS
jgi:hypothetical protein